MSFQRVLDSVGFYPISLAYVGATSALATVSCGFLTLVEGLVALLVVALLAGFLSTRRELANIRWTQSRLLARIDQLQQTLLTAQIYIPTDPTPELPMEPACEAILTPLLVTTSP